MIAASRTSCMDAYRVYRETWSISFSQCSLSLRTQNEPCVALQGVRYAASTARNLHSIITVYGIEQAQPCRSEATVACRFSKSLIYLYVLPVPMCAMLQLPRVGPTMSCNEYRRCCQSYSPAAYRKQRTYCHWPMLVCLPAPFRGVLHRNAVNGVAARDVFFRSNRRGPCSARCVIHR